MNFVGTLGDAFLSSSEFWVFKAFRALLVVFGFLLG